MPPERGVGRCWYCPEYAYDPFALLRRSISDAGNKSDVWISTPTNALPRYRPALNNNAIGEELDPTADNRSVGILAEVLGKEK